MRTRALLGLLFTVVAASACGSKSSEPSVPRAARVVFEPNAPQRFGAVPFPSDLYLEPDGSIGRGLAGFDRIVGAHAEALQQGLAGSRGFGRTSAMTFFVDGPAIDERTVASNAFLVEVEGTERVPVLVRTLPSLKCIVILPRPGAVLKRATRYAAVLTTAVRTTEGGALEPDVALRTIVASGARTTEAERLYGSAIDALVSRKHVAKATDVAGLSVFTTSSQVGELVALRDRLHRSFPAPQLRTDGAIGLHVFARTSTPSLDEWLGKAAVDEKGHDWPGLDNPGGVPHDAIGLVLTASYDAPSFLDGKSAHFEHEADRTVRVADANARVPVTIVVPEAAAPPTGYPVIIAGHGLGGTRNNLMAIANELARAGFVTIGIDDVAHGTRRGTADAKSNYAGTYRGPDGLPDKDQLAGIDFFAGFTGLLAIRDNFRQTILDHVSLVRMVRDPSVDLGLLTTAAGHAVAFDRDRVFYTGGSFGGINGATLASVEPEIRAFALQVPGGGFIQNVIIDSPSMGPLVASLVRTAYRVEGDELVDAFHPLTNLVAGVVEPGDPLAYAPHVFREPFEFDGKPRPRVANVLVTYALDDELLPNGATHALIRALGVTVAGAPVRLIDSVPVLPAPLTGNFGAGTGVAVEYAPATHALGYQRWGDRAYGPSDGGVAIALSKVIRVEMPVREHIAQVVHFFQTGAKGAAEAVITKPSRADFDGDGVLDADETRAGTDPLDPASR